MKIYDCIVVGLGGIGTAALRSAAEAGWSTIGLDRFGVAHDRGSSHGQTRIIRTAYYEHPNYVPFARESFAAWEEIESRTRQPLLQRTGLLQIGSPESEVIRGTLASATEHEVPLETLSREACQERFPMIRLAPDQIGLYETEAGFLRVERCVAATAKLAKEAGAELASGVRVDRWKVNSDGLVEVFAGDRTWRGRRLILCPGPWAGQLLGDLAGPLRVVRKQQTWFQLDRIDIRAANGFPAFLMDTPLGVFYGLPEIDYLGMKIAEHSGGREVTDPDQVDRRVNPQDQQLAEQFLDDHFVFGRRRLVHDSCCLYTLSCDHHFVIARHPESGQVVFAAGMSGHGFKFAPLVGRQLIRLLQGADDPMWRFLQAAGRW